MEARIFFIVAILATAVVSIAQGAENIHSPVENDGEMLIKIARDMRDGVNGVKVNTNRAIHFYEYAIERGSDALARDAVWELLQLLEENPTMTSKFSTWDLLVRSAESGNSDAQHKLSASLATGIFEDGLVPMDPSRSLVLEYVSALSGNAVAAMSMGYRYYFGLGVPESCEKALPYYEFTANTAAKYLEEKGYIPVVDRSRLNDVIESQSKGMKNEFTIELADYYAHLAENGDVSAATTLGTIYSTGLRLIPVDQEKALYFLELAAKQKYGPGCGLLGYLLLKKYMSIIHSPSYLKGEMELPLELAPSRIANLLQLGVQSNDINGMVGIALAHNYGIGVALNQSKALETLQKYSLQHPDAGYYLAEILVKSALSQVVATGGKLNNLRNHDLGIVIQGYSASSQLGNILSQHRLAHLANRGIGVQRNCESVLSGFKAVSERGPWAESLNVAQNHFLQQRYAKALHIYSQLAVLGIEPAQFNAAYILKNRHCPSLLESKDMAAAAKLVDHVPEVATASNVSIAAWKKLETSWKTSSAVQLQAPVSSQSVNSADKVDNVECETRALSLFGLSAAQGNAESFVTIGDYFYYGLASLNASRSVSTIYYQKAAELHNTQAIFNLGLMHEFGDGVMQDFHLAKRYYDLAAEVDPKAKLPRDIALFIMDIHKMILGALDCSSIFDSDVDKVERCNALLLNAKDYVCMFMENALVADKLIRDVLNKFFTHFRSFRSDSGTISNEWIPNLVKYKLKHSARLFMESVLESEFLEKDFKVSGFSIFGQELVSMALLCSLLVTLIVIRKFFVNIRAV